MSRPAQLFVFGRQFDAVVNGMKKQVTAFGHTLPEIADGDAFELVHRVGTGRVIFARGECVSCATGEFRLGGPDSGHAIFGGVLHDHPKWCAEFARAEGFSDWNEFRTFHVKVAREVFLGRVVRWNRLNIFPAALAKEGK